MTYDLTILKKIIITAAREELLSRFTKVERYQKADGSILTEADLACQQTIAEQLQQEWPDTVFLGEEMSAEQQRELFKSDQPVWCLDPLDGTSNFASGIPYFCVSLALIQDGQVVLGVVYDPMRDEYFAADQEQGATFNGEPLVVATTGLNLRQTTAIIDFKRLTPALATRLVSDIPYASQRSFGSVALDWCWLALGRGHVYLHGRSNIWDYAAGNYIFNKAGGHSCTLEGEDIFINELTPRSSVGAVDDVLFKEWTSWIGVSG
ncbi:MAG: inositol monophosphatase family protein [Gammaproteobacteria bacterium]